MAGNFEKKQSNWDRLGEEDPLWTILSDPAKRGGKWDVVEFFDKGRAEISSLMKKIEGLSLPLKRETALDFGCGVGRLTSALSHYFDAVIGVDISPSMIRRAKELNRDNGKCTFMLNDCPNLKIIESESADLIYSSITLQHIQPKVIQSYLHEFFRIIRPGGLVVFQLPAGYDWSLRGLCLRFMPNWIAGLIRKKLYHCSAVYDMYRVPCKQVLEIIHSVEGNVAHFEQDWSAGPGWISYRYYAIGKAE